MRETRGHIYPVIEKSQCLRPSVEFLMIDWVMTELDDQIFYTDCLSQHYPLGLAIKAIASGLLVLKISKLRRYLILWFRPEVLQTITWAGNPHESFQQSDEGHLVLSPRTSFAQWKETVEATALPWKRAEVDNALTLKHSIVGIVLNKADELAQINAELERKNRELESFAYAASHDLKEPLRGINNFTNIIMKRHGEQLDKTGLNRLKTLIRLAQRMDALIDALLKFSRLGQTELNDQLTNIHTIVSNVIDGLSASYEGTGTTPQFQIPRPLPSVICDPVLIGDVFSNLIGNSIKYTKSRNPVIEIGYVAAQEQQGQQKQQGHRADDQQSQVSHVQPEHVQPGKGPIFYVKDDGIGIHERHFQTIFRLFKRLHDRESYGGGTGVGLTIAKKIIERHGGQIWVESNDGQGTTFFFMLSYADNS
ncbi:MAG: hypothetical protein F6K16_37110 [Symploca sp. SIO2B6]|nr:hypothetical protein [Symploca sp. SIO2B6]